MIGPAMAKKLAKLDISTVNDLVNHYPARYLDYRLISAINKIGIGETVTIKAQIINFENIFTRSGKRIQQVLVGDRTGQIQITFFNQTYLAQVFKAGMEVNFSGKVIAFNNKITLVSPEFEIIRNNLIHTGRLVPVYPETYGVSSKWLRSRIFPLIKNLKTTDWLPEKVKQENKLMNLLPALQQIHFPDNWEMQQMAKQRLGFDELFLLHIRGLIQKNNWSKQITTKPLLIDQSKTASFIKSLPFELTQDQKKVLAEIFDNLEKTTPMNRLLQGDVGSGKTIVAAIAAFNAFLNNTQTILMAPTEILAVQHYQTFNKFLSAYKIRIGLHTSSKKTDPDNQDIIIGTHALIQKKINFNNLGLVIIDEQQRFGVGQRATLTQKGKNPHILTMTATPIPRTIALTLYGDLDMSVINQMPKGRLPVKTWVVSQNKHQAAYNWIKQKIKKEKIQVFIVCPLIEESESLADVKAVTQEFQFLQKEFSGFKLGLLHGRLKSKQKDGVIKDFKSKKIHILVSTPVVEVGIDVPQAAIMVIEGAERFGLSSLHQLRGRVGRRNNQGYCLLFSSNNQSHQRLLLMEKFASGLKLAEMDLKFRGPGQIFGTVQHGFIKLKIASFSDVDLIEKTKTEALKYLEGAGYNLDKLPLLKEKLKKDTITTIKPN